MVILSAFLHVPGIIFFLFKLAFHTSVIPTGGAGEVVGGGNQYSQEPVLPDEEMPGMWCLVLQLGMSKSSVSLYT